MKKILSLTIAILLILCSFSGAYADTGTAIKIHTDFPEDLPDESGKDAMITIGITITVLILTAVAVVLAVIPKKEKSNENLLKRIENKIRRMKKWKKYYL